MTSDFSRRQFMGALGWLGASTLVRPGLVRAHDQSPPDGSAFDFRIRTVTAGVPMNSGDDFEALEEAFRFLDSARSSYQEQGYEVQTIRIATQSVTEYLPDWNSEKGMSLLESLDTFATDRNIMFNIGPLIMDDRYDGEIARWAVELNKRTQNISCTVFVASAEHGIHRKTTRTAAEIIAGLAQNSEGGEGNFRFAATAYCPPGTPFFPAAYHEGPASFAVGLETPRLLQKAFSGATDIIDAQSKLRSVLNEAMKPIESQANNLSRRFSRPYLGIDVSPAPGLDASIGEAIETLTGTPFGGMSTLSACAAITDVLKSLDVQICGYSGLMLPVLEDPVLAKRADEGRYGISELLLYSTVCGTGLDVIPLPGDTPVETMQALITDVASLSHKYQKPLSARLFPVPGKNAGDHATFENPFLGDSRIMSIE